MKNIEEKNDDGPVMEVLAVDQVEARRLLGGISRTSLWKLERAGLVPALPGIGRKLYSVEALRIYTKRGVLLGGVR